MYHFYEGRVKILTAFSPAMALLLNWELEVD